MASLNSTSFIGNLAAEPTVKTINNQTVVNFRIAINEIYKEQERTTWVNVSAWNDLADYAMANLHKGSQVYLSGKLEISTWDRPVMAPISKEEFTVKTDMYSINCDEIIATSDIKLESDMPIMSDVPIMLSDEAN